GFTRMSVRGKSQVHNEIGFALMAVNLRKFTAINKEKHNNFHLKTRKSGVVYKKHVNHTTFIYLRLVMSQPLFYCIGNNFSHEGYPRPTPVPNDYQTSHVSN